VASPARKQVQPPDARPTAGRRARAYTSIVPTATGDKEKVSLTLDKTLLADIRERFGQRALSTTINDLLHAALARQRLAELVDEMEAEAGPPSTDSFDRVLTQWFAEG
jgi:hypothetical protein